MRIASLLVLLVSPPAPGATDHPVCHRAKVALEDHIGALPTRCESSRECMVRHLHTDSCLPPYVIHRRYDPNKDEQLAHLQESVSQACKAELAEKPVCSPRPETAVCHEGRCTPKSWLPPEVPEALYEERYRFATVTPGCAPHDASSWVLAFTPKKAWCGAKETFPAVTVNWWNRRPRLPVQAFQLDEAGRANLAASFCGAEGACTPAERLTLKFDRLDSRGGKGTFKLRLPRGKTVTGDFEAEFCQPNPPTPCG